MASSMRVFVPLVFLLLASIVAPGAKAAVSPCDMVWGNLYPCSLDMPKPLEGTLLDNCCEGLRLINEAGKTTPDRQSICYCVKSYLALQTPQNLTYYATLPSVCNVGLTYKFDLSPDC